MKSPQLQKLFPEAEYNWHLEGSSGLYEILAKKKGCKKLPDRCQNYLRGLLVGQPPTKITEVCDAVLLPNKDLEKRREKLKKRTKVIRVDISKYIYEPLRDLLEEKEIIEIDSQSKNKRNQYFFRLRNYNNGNTDQPFQKWEWHCIPELLEKAGYKKDSSVSRIVENAKSQISSISKIKTNIFSKNTSSSVIQITSIREFWEKNLNKGQYVSISGTLSPFAPMLIGQPKLKRKVHRLYRRNISAKQADEQGAINTNLVFTSGQMVWQLELQETPWIYLGLYHSIVRNSIPIFVNREYYLREVKNLFITEDEKIFYTRKAHILGKLETLPESFIKEFIESNQLEFDNDIGLDDKRVFSLFVNGEASTKIQALGESRYLDGDIWVALELNGKQFFVSQPGIDLSDPEDFRNAYKQLMKEVEKYLQQGAKVICQFTENKEFFE